MKRNALIYRPAKTAMQSGTAKTKQWRLDFLSEDRKFIDPMMGWIGSQDTTRQLTLTFTSADEAVAYAKANNIAYELRDNPKTRSLQPKSYAANFAHNRRYYSD